MPEPNPHDWRIETQTDGSVNAKCPCGWVGTPRDERLHTASVDRAIQDGYWHEYRTRREPKKDDTKKESTE